MGWVLRLTLPQHRGYYYMLLGEEKPTKDELKLLLRELRLRGWKFVDHSLYRVGECWG